MALHLAARKYLGVPFLHQGRDPSVGIDCIGQLYLSCRDEGLACAEQDTTDYSRHPHGGLLESHLNRIFGPPLPLSQLQVNAIVSLRYGAPVRHVGIVGEITYGDHVYLSLIHTDSRIGKVVEHRITPDLLNPLSRPCLVGVYLPEHAIVR